MEPLPVPPPAKRPSLRAQAKHERIRRRRHPLHLQRRGSRHRPDQAGRRHRKILPQRTPARHLDGEQPAGGLHRLCLPRAGAQMPAHLQPMRGFSTNRSAAAPASPPSSPTPKVACAWSQPSSWKSPRLGKPPKLTSTPHSSNNQHHSQPITSPNLTFTEKLLLNQSW